ncbi:hypothetical protein DH2020_019736 [Rehmannia glutinosa]|uniref:Uncharacterized protein n=1 Tax=Rehmannia glutinosa TaxID=99300 RepID=A0ABR0WEL6_REHGL
MDPPADDIELKPEKLGEEKEGGPLFHCDFYDMDIVYKVGQALLPGLASACIDNTIGGIFKTPASVAVDIRREMVDYLIQRSENFVAESVVLEGGPDVEVSVDPHDIISDFVDDFLVKCPFYSVGCQSTIPQCTIEQHRSDSLPSHLLYILQVFHKEASAEDLKERSKELEKLSSPGQLASARDARSLTTVIKNLEKKLGPLKINTNSKLNEEVPDSIEKKEEKTGMPNKHVRFENPPGEKEEIVNSHSKVIEHEDSIHEKGELMESSTIVSTQSQTNEKEVVASISVQENLKESPFQREKDLGSPTKVDVQMEKLSIEENLKESPLQKEEDLGSPTEVDAQMGTLSKEETLKESPFQKEEDLGSPTKVDVQKGKLSKEGVGDPIKEERFIRPEKLTDSDAEREKHAKSPARNEVSTKSPHGEEFLISSDREVDKESIPGKEQTDSLN